MAEVPPFRQSLLAPNSENVGVAGFRRLPCAARRAVAGVGPRVERERAATGEAVPQLLVDSHVAVGRFAVDLGRQTSAAKPESQIPSASPNSAFDSTCLPPARSPGSPRLSPASVAEAEGDVPSPSPSLSPGLLGGPGPRVRPWVRRWEHFWAFPAHLTHGAIRTPARLQDPFNGPGRSRTSARGFEVRRSIH
jgi:hypothetical protein